MKDGGPAFPVPARTQEQQDRDIWPDYGMSLRDYFAAKALANLPGPYAVGHGIPQGRNPSHVAREAYDIADAMLAAREKGDE